MRLMSASEESMVSTRIIAGLFTVFSATSARTAEPAVSHRSPPLAPAIATSLTTAPQVPLLFIVDGVRYQRGHEPLLSNDQIFAVRVIKGSAAIRMYGQEASYGVVLIITKQAAGPRA